MFAGMSGFDDDTSFVFIYRFRSGFSGFSAIKLFRVSNSTETTMWTKNWRPWKWLIKQNVENSFFPVQIAYILCGPWSILYGVKFLQAILNRRKFESHEKSEPLNTQILKSSSLRSSVWGTQYLSVRKKPISVFPDGKHLVRCPLLPKKLSSFLMVNVLDSPCLKPR